MSYDITKDKERLTILAEAMSDADTSVYMIRQQMLEAMARDKKENLYSGSKSPRLSRKDKKKG